MPVAADRVIAVDTSVAIPLLVSGHTAHGSVVEWWAGRELSLSGHAAVETYSVLTRLPGDLRLKPADAARLIGARFSRTLLLNDNTSARLPALLAKSQIAGGAFYDYLVALAAQQHRCVLATRDARARVTYEALKVPVEVVP